MSNADNIATLRERADVAHKAVFDAERAVEDAVNTYRKENPAPAGQFNGSSGRKPQTEARRYVYAVLATAIEHDGDDIRGWLFGGLEDEPDRRRVEKAAKAIVKELRRKAKA